MEKVQINNQVISMRKLVRQAKVHVINKLVKQVKLLKNRNGDEAKVSKYKRKAERLLLEINLLKKINADVVSKMALANEDCKNMISDKSLTVENRAMARLASFGPVQKETKQFYSKFPHLVNLLPGIFEQWEVKKHSDVQDITEQKSGEKQKRKGKSSKKRPLSTDSGHHEPVLNENLSSGTEENLSEMDILSPESETEENKHQEGGKEKNIQLDSNKLHHVKKTSQSKASMGKFFGGSRDFSSKSKKAGSTLGAKSHYHMSKFKSSGSSNYSYYGNKFKHKTKYSDKFKKMPSGEKSAMSDRTNKRSIVSGVSTKSARQQNTSFWAGSGANNELKKRKKFDPSYGASGDKRTAPKDFSKRKHDISTNQKSGMASGEKINFFKKTDEKTSAVLHPSWAAKRKMNVDAKSFVPFQGKKVKFDE